MEDTYEWHEEDWNEYEEDLHDSDDLNDDNDSEYEYDRNDYDNNNNIYDPRPYTAPIVWTQVKIGTTVVYISSAGKYKLNDSTAVSMDGIILHGTPYRFATIEGQRFLMHDLVWQAFYGAVPDGWEVRHKSEYVNARRRKIYSNSLSNINIYGNVVTNRNITFG